MSKFTWVPFYKELAEKLLEYKDRRDELIEFIFSEEGLKEFSSYLHLKNKSYPINDIDPFTFMGMFNRGNMTIDNRKIILAKIKEKFGITAKIPSDFDGIPVLNRSRMLYYDWDNLGESCNMLWNLFETVMNDSLQPWFDYYKFKTRRAECTMPLFWYKPNDYIALDSRNVKYLKQKGIDVDVDDANSYLNLLKTIKNKMDSDELTESSFAEISYNAWKNTEESSLKSAKILTNANGVIPMNKSYIQSDISKKQKIINLLKSKKNIILQGAPGTGKTYITAEIALGLCGEQLDYTNHDAVMKKYKEYVDNGRIGFVTFHQSMDYEDFIEGIKPKTDVADKIIYEIEDGIFKSICDEARSIISAKQSEIIDFSKTRVFKMSLGDKNEADEIFSYCLENNVIALGWGEDKDFSNCTKREEFRKKDKSWGATAMEIFKMSMKKGDIVLISDRLKGIKAIARVIGDYVYDNATPISMCQFRKVEWLYNGETITTNKIYGKSLSQQSIYGFYDNSKFGKPNYNGSLNVDYLNEIITGNVNKEKPKPYILIIDEINRGNVSKIFGELITLLEADKRTDGSHPISVTLPYSKKKFLVPSNLYIIGTMNTTDRSVGSIDYAVRRRFSFVTLNSDKEIVERESKAGKAVYLFDSVRNFIAKNKIDMDIEDLMVGHSYFLAEDDNALQMKWEYDIVPLLREYYKDGIIKSDIEKNISIEKFIGQNSASFQKADNE